MNKCKLCGLERILRKSHIIPKFVTRYLKETSMTGYLRTSENINRRVQDSMKIPLLCNDCEQKFSKWESQFATHLFLPHNRSIGSGKSLIKIEYDSVLIKFVISLFWRIIIASRVTETINQTNIELIQNFEQPWTDFLNEKRYDWGEYEFHIFLLDQIDHKYMNQLPIYLNTYMWRLFTWKSYNINGNIGFYIKIPGMFLLCSITPPKIANMEESLIHSTGIMYPNKQNDPSKIIGILLLEGAYDLERELTKISSKEFNKIGYQTINKAINILQNTK